MPLLVVDSLDLRKLLGMAADQKYIAPRDLQQAKIESPRSQKPTTFMVWAQQLVFKQENELSPLEKKGVDLFNRLRAYQDHRAGRRLEILPLADSAEKQWISLDSLVRSKLDDETDPSGSGAGIVRMRFPKLRAAYLAQSPAEFNEASHKFLGLVREMGPLLGAYPEQRTIDLEVAYNHWAPFRFAWVLMLVACLCVALQLGSGWKPLYPLGLASYAAGMVAILIGFFMRVTISGRAPVTNMYESVVHVGFGVAAIGLILELIYRKRFIAVAAAAVSTVALVLADNCPSVLDSSLQPLQPVLRNNFWLVIHVMTITLSYAALALAMGIANITLGYLPRAQRESRGDRGPQPIHLSGLAGGRRSPGHRDLPGRHVGRVFLGPFLGLGSQGSLGLDRAVGLSGGLALPLCRLGQAPWVGGPGRGLLRAGDRGLVRRKLRAWRRPAQLRLRRRREAFHGLAHRRRIALCRGGLVAFPQVVGQRQAAPAAGQHAGRRRFDVARGSGLNPG